MVFLSVTEGDDKSLKKTRHVPCDSDLMLLNRCDLLVYLTSNLDIVNEYAHRINPALPTFGYWSRTV